MKNIRDRFFVQYKRRNKNVWVTKRLDTYLVGLSKMRLRPSLVNDYEDLMRQEDHTYQTPLNQLEFIAMIAKQANVKTVLELGTFKGFTSLYLATELGKDARITTCELDNKNITDAQKLWKKHSVDKQITVLAGNAVQTIKKLTEKYDMIYIDADKSQYPAYYKAALRLRKKDGLIIMDNMLWAGLVAHKDSGYSHATLLGQLNEAIYSHGHASVSMIPAWDGLLLIKG